MKKINGIIMQYFEWYMDCKQNLWNQIKENAEKLSEIGITVKNLNRFLNYSEFDEEFKNNKNIKL